MSFLYHLAIGVFVCAIANMALAQELGFSHDELQELYSRMESNTKKHRYMNETFFYRNRDKIDTKDPEMMAVIESVEEELGYQDVIDKMHCLERYYETKYFEKCLRERRDHIKAMRRFVYEYSSFKHVMERCRAKSREFELEVRYPPYPHMTTGPQAFDGKRFLTCAREMM